MEGDGGTQLHKRHQQRKSKAERKKSRRREKNGETKHNPRAFTFSGGVVSVQRKVQRSLDRRALKEKEEKTDKTPDVPPPYIVVVQGPPGVGKTTLIRSLVKHYTRHSLQVVQGPITLVASKQRRLTFIECSGTDVQQMLDLAKIADLVLLLIDADFGFEMETFEFINILQVHGFPRVIGVLTHLDSIADRNNQKALRKRKKQLKNRFWTEIYDGAKLFYLTGLQYGRYKKREILNLSRYIAVQKFAPLSWRSAHPYLLALRWEPGFSPSRRRPVGEDGEEDEVHQMGEEKCSCIFYGYVRGAVLRQGQSIHIPGAGDFHVSSLSCCDDPCPPPQPSSLSLPSTDPTADESPGGVEGNSLITNPVRSRRKSARSLKDQQRAIYAPAADVGNVRVDADAMYIHLPDTKVSFTRPENLIHDGRGGSLKGKKKKGAGKEATTEGDGSTSTREETEEEDEDEEENSCSSEEEEGDEDGMDLGAGKRPLLEKQKKKGDEEGLTDAIKMVRTLQDADRFIDKQLNTQELRLLPFSSRTLARSKDQVDKHDERSSGDLPAVRQLDVVRDEEEEDYDGEEDDGDSEEGEEEIQNSAGKKYSKRTRRPAPSRHSSSRNAAEEEDDDEDDVSGDGDSQEEDEDQVRESEEDESSGGGELGNMLDTSEDEGELDDSIASIHEAARRRFSRQPSLKEIIYLGREIGGGGGSSKRSNGIAGEVKKRGGDGKLSSKNRRGSSHGEKKIPLFEDEEEEEEQETERSDTFSPSQQKNSSGGAGLYGNLPSILPACLRRRRREKEEQEEGGEEGVDGDDPCSIVEEEEGRQDTSWVSDRVMYAAVGVFGDEEERRKYWTQEKIESIKARCFITGGWSSGEEDEKKKNSAVSDSGAAAKASVQLTEEEIEEQKRKHSQEQQRLMNESRQLQFQDQRNDGLGVSAHGDEAYSGACASIGSFVRVYVENLPRIWIESLHASRPVLLGGLCAGEQTHTFLQARVKKHRWFPKILKSDDVLLFSAGWRRFQSLPMYALEDRSNARMRYLKYTPEHLHCLAYFWAPGLPPATPVLAIRDTRATANFRVSATGLVLQTSPSVQLSKKLKLLGEPKKIFKNTAFIKGMFNSDLEVNMCIGAKIQTVSGIRGQVKKAAGTDGTFRATFEDKILMSDLIVCKTWLKIQPRQFFNPVLDIEGWRRLRTQAEIRQSLQIPVASKPEDASLGALQAARRSKVFNPIRVPKQLMLKLPFSSRTKLLHRTSKLRQLKGKDKIEELDLRKPLVSTYDRRVAALLQRLQTIKNARLEKRKEQQKEKRQKKALEERKKEEAKARKQVALRKKRYVKQGKIEMGMRKRMRISGDGKASRRNEDD